MERTPLHYACCMTDGKCMEDALRNMGADDTAMDLVILYTYKHNFDPLTIPNARDMQMRCYHGNTKQIILITARLAVR